MNIREIKPGIYWLGALHPELKVFDVIMETKWGTTYNSYLIKGEKKTALIEVVKDMFGGAHLEKIRAMIDPKTIDYIVINHSEPDHSGALGSFLKEAPNAVVVSSRVANTLLKEITNGEFPSIIVKDGDTIDLGGKTLSFIAAPFLHWPDSMFTYVPEDGVLFSGDVFGCHYCSDDEHIFNDEIEADIVQAQRYYFDVIMSPFKLYMIEAIDKIRTLKIDVICPGHGPILREGPWDTVQRMEDWSKDIFDVNDPKKIFIGFVSAYGNTKRLGEAIMEGIQEVGGFDITMLDVSENSLAEIIPLIDQADGLLFGSPTINRDALEPVWLVLSNISVFKCKGKPSAAFGSYGWSGEAVGMLEERMKGLQMKVLAPGYRTKMVPDAQAIEEAKGFGKKFAQTLMPQ